MSHIFYEASKQLVQYGGHMFDKEKGKIEKNIRGRKEGCKDARKEGR